MTPASATTPPSRAFCDVDDGRFYSTVVDWAKVVGITSGVTATDFDPNGTTTRGQIVTMLHRYVAWSDNGAPEINTAHGFSEIVAGAYYEGPVRWAATSGVTTGTGADRFEPDATATRAQLATFVHQLAPRPPSSTDAFDDVPARSWFADAAHWLWDRELTTGTSHRRFSPDAVSLRDGVITFLWRLSDEPTPGEFLPAPYSRTFTVIGDSVIDGIRVGSVLTDDTFPGWDGGVGARGCRQPLITPQARVCGRSPIPSALLTIQTAIADGTLGAIVILHVGTNGALDADSLDQLIAASIGHVDTLWLMTIRSPWSNQVAENELIRAAVDQRSPSLDSRALDWEAMVAGNPSLVGHGIHLTLTGRTAMRDLISDALAASYEQP
ncbi:MAG: hypothetical protein ACI9C1_003001 [Candidatus Aldehydirespiratoraceae bacterium]